MKMQNLPKFSRHYLVRSEDQKYKIRGQFTCQSSKLVYVMTFSICILQCVGETENTLNVRTRGHESSMRGMNDSPVLKHYRSYNCNNHIIKDCVICAGNKETDNNRRFRLEETWMILLDTLSPKGLNSRW